MADQMILIDDKTSGKKVFEAFKELAEKDYLCECYIADIEDRVFIHGKNKYRTYYFGDIHAGKNFYAELSKSVGCVLVEGSEGKKEGWIFFEDGKETKFEEKEKFKENFDFDEIKIAPRRCEIKIHGETYRKHYFPDRYLKEALKKLSPEIKMTVDGEEVILDSSDIKYESVCGPSMENIFGEEIIDMILKKSKKKEIIIERDDIEDRFEIGYHIAGMGGAPYLYLDHEKKRLFTLNEDADVTDGNALFDKAGKLKALCGNIALTGKYYPTVGEAKAAAKKMDSFDQFGFGNENVPEKIKIDYCKKRAYVEECFRGD